MFFGITGGADRDRPDRRRLPDEWTWRAIFWINIPVAIIALILIWLVQARTTSAVPRRWTTAARCWSPAAMGLIVLGLQQSSIWGWSSAAHLGVHRRPALLLLVGSCCWSCARRRRCCGCGSSATAAFAVENAVLGLMSIVFVPFFFFASVYAQVSLGESRVERRRLPAVLLPRLRDRRPGRRAGSSTSAAPARPVVLGCAIGAVGFFLLAGKLTDLSLSAQWPYDRCSPAAGIGLDARPGQHRRGQPRAEHELQRGHRHHPDRAQLRRQPRPGGARRDPDQPRQRRTSPTR